MPPQALSVYADGRMFDAIRIAKIFAGERGGIATFPELVQASLDRPNDPALHTLTMSSSIVAFGRQNGRSRYKGFVSHHSGLVEDVTVLQDAYERAFASQPKSALGNPNYGHLDLEHFTAYARQEESYRIPVICESRNKHHARSRVCTNDMLRKEMGALLGPHCSNIIARRRAQLPYPKGNAYEQQAWRNGSIQVSLFNDNQTEASEFQDGKYVLVTPLVYMHSEGLNAPPGSPWKMSAIPWFGDSMHIMAWKNRADQSGEILRDPQSLSAWKLGRPDCLHPTEPPLPAILLPYIIGNANRGQPEETLSACRVCQDDEGFFGAIPDPVCRVEVIELLGEHVFTNIVVGEPFSPEEWATLITNAPPGTQAIRTRIERAKIKDECGPCGHMHFADRLPIEYVRIRPREDHRYLTNDELLADPHAYLRLIGAT